MPPRQRLRMRIVRRQQVRRDGSERSKREHNQREDAGAARLERDRVDHDAVRPELTENRGDVDRRAKHLALLDEPPGMTLLLTENAGDLGRAARKLGNPADVQIGQFVYADDQKMRKLGLGRIRWGIVQPPAS